jgi:hypothetical protein
MKLLFRRDTEAQDAFLDEKGYRLSKMPFHQVSWTNKSSYIDTNVYIDSDESKQVLEVGLQGKATKSCYDNIKADILDTGFVKDGESVSNDGELSLYYSNTAYGVVFCKSLSKGDDSGKPYYFVVLMSKSRYKYAMSFDKNIR